LIVSMSKSNGHEKINTLGAPATAGKMTGKAKAMFVIARGLE